MPAAVTITSSKNPSAHSDAVTFAAVVTPTTPGGPVPTGTVHFTSIWFDAIETLVNGKASFTCPPNRFPLGTWMVAAIYSGDANYGSAVGEMHQQVFVLVLTSSQNPCTENAPITFTVDGLREDATGTVTFYSDGSYIGTSTVAGGQAQLTVSDLAAGTHLITAHYEGDAVYPPTTTTDYTQTVLALCSYTVRYVNFFSGNAVAPEIHGTGSPGDAVTVTAPKIGGYLLTDTSSKTITLTAGSLNTVSFAYMSIAQVFASVITGVFGLALVLLCGFAVFRSAG